MGKREVTLATMEHRKFTRRRGLDRGSQHSRRHAGRICTDTIPGCGFDFCCTGCYGTSHHRRRSRPLRLPRHRPPLRRHLRARHPQQPRRCRGTGALQRHLRGFGSTASISRRSFESGIIANPYPPGNGSELGTAVHRSRKPGAAESVAADREQAARSQEPRLSMGLQGPVHVWLRREIHAVPR